MIPFIRSFSELMSITKSRDSNLTNFKIQKETNLTEQSAQRKRYLKSQGKESITLPDLPKRKRQRWIRGRRVISRFLDELDYNNQIQSSLDLILLNMQNNYDQNDVA